MKLYLDENQLVILDETLRNILKDYDLVETESEFTIKESKENSILLMNFLDQNNFRYYLLFHHLLYTYH